MGLSCCESIQSNPLEDFFELVSVDSIHLADFLLTIDLLDHIKPGLFDLVCLLRSAATWSRARHPDVSGQPPLRTRAFSAWSVFIGASGSSESSHRQLDH